jgi:hypothetical protein
MTDCRRNRVLGGNFVTRFDELAPADVWCVTVN